MRNVTLTVPAEYAEDFRAALVHDLAEETGYVKKERKELLNVIEMRKDTESQRDAHRTAMKMLDREVELFRQAGYEGAGDIEISMGDDQGVVAYAFETVARQIIGPRLADALHVGPIDQEWAAQLRELIERLTWAIDQAAEVNASYFPGRDKEAVA